MRYLPTPQHYSAASLRAGQARPPLDQLPDDIAALLTEYDAAGVRESAARAEMQRLADPARDSEAAAADAATAKDAARARKVLPKPKAVPDLGAAREVATRQHAAEIAATHEVETDIRTAVADWRDKHGAGAATAARNRARALHAQATQLADDVEAAVAHGALDDWLASAVYYTRADIWAADAIPRLESHWGLGRSETTPISAREVILNTVATVLEKEETS